MAKPDVLVFVESRGGTLKRASRETLAEGHRLAKGREGRLGAVLLGAVRLGEGARKAVPQGVSVAYVCEDPLFERFHPEAFAHALKAAIDDLQPGVFLAAATPLGREIAPLAAHRLDTAVAADAIDVRWNGDFLEARRPVYAGKAVATVRCLGAAVVTLRPNTFSAEGLPATPPARIVDLPAPAASSIRAKVVEAKPAPGAGTGADRLELTEADIIVSGGRGLKNPESFAMLEELAKTLGAAVGASRAVCDAGWRPHSDQVGQTGKTVTPKLYIACGISGAIQHLAGMSSSKCIVAINKDPAAPIFQVADYGIVGDVFEVVPALTEKLKAFLA